MAEGTEEPQGEQIIDPDAAADAAKKAMASIRGLFAELSPPEESTIVDALGNEYRIGSTCSARAQIKMMHEFENVLGSKVSIAEFQAAWSSEGGGAAAAGKMLVTTMKDPAVLESIARSFEISRPFVYADAAKAWSTKTGKDFDGDASDLFPLEEIANGLVPFFVRFAVRMTETVTNLAPTE